MKFPQVIPRISHSWIRIRMGKTDGQMDKIILPPAMAVVGAVSCLFSMATFTLQSQVSQIFFWLFDDSCHEPVHDNCMGEDFFIQLIYLNNIIRLKVIHSKGYVHFWDSSCKLSARQHIVTGSNEYLLQHHPLAQYSHIWFPKMAITLYVRLQNSIIEYAVYGMTPHYAVSNSENLSVL